MKDLQQGPLRMGSLPFLRPFYFSDGRPCNNFNELVLACDQHWEEARWALAQGLWAEFFGGNGRLDLTTAAKQAAQEPDRDHGLSQLLERLPADPDFLRLPKLVVDPVEIELGQLTPGKDRICKLEIMNQGMLLLHGLAWLNCDWLVFDDRLGSSLKMFQTRNSCTLSMLVLGSKLHAGLMPLKGEIVFETNSGILTVPVCAEVPIHPFPKGCYANDSLAGARSPRELVLKAKQSLQQAAVLFEQGAVKDWYASNGWVYPVEDWGCMGLGAVQQFFEALGLTRPPHLEMKTDPLFFRGKIGESLLRQVTVRTKEHKPVYAQAWSNQPWVKIRPIKSLGNKASIVLEVVVPPFPGETLAALVTVQGNGNQKFVVPLYVMVEKEEQPLKRISNLFGKWIGKRNGP